MRDRWTWSADMTGDGFVTISDVWASVLWAFYLPGDLAVFYLRRSRPQLIEDITFFFETTPPDYGGWLSLSISAVVWLGCCGLLCETVKGLRSDAVNRASAVRNFVPRWGGRVSQGVSESRQPEQAPRTKNGKR
jgi:hypothetical protein